MPIHKLTRTGDSYQVTIPVDMVRRWLQDVVIGVEVEWVGPAVLITPITLRGLQLIKARAGGKEGVGGDDSPQR